MTRMIEVRGFSKPGSEMVPATSRLQCLMLHLVASDLNGQSRFLA